MYIKQSRWNRFRSQEISFSARFWCGSGAFRMWVNCIDRRSKNITSLIHIYTPLSEMPGQCPFVMQKRWTGGTGMYRWIIFVSRLFVAETKRSDKYVFVCFVVVVVIVFLWMKNWQWRQQLGLCLGLAEHLVESTVWTSEHMNISS